MLGKLIRSKTAAVVTTAIVTATVVGGIAYAASSPIDNAGVIHGCYNPSNGAISLKTGAACPLKGKTTPISWNSQGVQGIQGIQGVPGANGNDGAPGVKGDTGDQGIQGPIGDDGAQGPAGSSEVAVIRVIPLNTYSAPWGIYRSQDFEGSAFGDYWSGCASGALLADQSGCTYLVAKQAILTLNLYNGIDSGGRDQNIIHATWFGVTCLNAPYTQQSCRFVATGDQTITVDFGSTAP